MKSNNPRRRFLQLGLGATAGIITTGLACNQQETAPPIAETTEAVNCTLTTEQTIGPFYPHIKNGDGDMDLTTIQGKEGKAEGDVITQMYFEGEELNKSDLLIHDLPEEERGQFILSPEQNEKGIPVFSFDLTLKKVASSAERLAALDACAGKYQMELNFGTPKAEGIIRRDDQKLFLDIDGYTSVELKPTGKDEFTCPGISKRLVFNRNGDNTVNSVTLHSIVASEKIAPTIAMKM